MTIKQNTKTIEQNPNPERGIAAGNVWDISSRINLQVDSAAMGEKTLQHYLLVEQLQVLL